ncbi:MAG: NAD-dependent epimerase/dehydratase family protein [candidate division Zixibacteria bacterium]|nr:NAD-dependent epimerase/dehydratase family protein [candidate division Zixibacteria bacterium]
MTIIASVTGGTGFIGRHLVTHLVEHGVRVRVLTRRPELMRGLWPTEQVEPWEGDLTKPETLRGFATNARIIYHLAGENRNADNFEMVNVTGTKNLLELCRDQDLEKFVHVSSTGPMGGSRVGLIDESTSCYPRNSYERSKYAGEQIAIDAFGKFQIPVTVIRPPNVFGEGRPKNGDLWLSWLTAIRGGRFRFFGSGDSVANYIYAGDLVGACLLVAGSDKATGEVYIVSDSCPLRDFVGAAAEFLGVMMPRTLPVWFGYAVALCLEMTGKLAHFSPPLTVSRVRALTNRATYSSEKLCKGLGFRPAFGWREGLRRTIEWYKQNKLL